MYIELRHLRTIRAIQQAGGLARAAEVLNMTQSAPPFPGAMAPPRHCACGTI